MTKTFFDNPSRVLFIEPNNGKEWVCGVAYKDVVAAGWGAIFAIDEIVEYASELGIQCAIQEV